MSSDPSSSSASSSSGPSSIDSQRSQQVLQLPKQQQQHQQLHTPQRQLPKSPLAVTGSPLSNGNATTPKKVNGNGGILYDDTLVVIEKSNQDLEQKLNNNKQQQQQQQTNMGNGSAVARRTIVNGKSPKTTTSRVPITRPRIDTIHNNRNLSQEVIYEVEENGQQCLSQQQQQLQEASLSRSSSQTTIKQLGSNGLQASSVTASYPSLSDLSINDIGSNFKSLTAQKLMAGMSFNSIDTLIEVNAAADARKNLNLNESTETVDFGVI